TAVKHFAKCARLEIGRDLPQIIAREHDCEFVVRVRFLTRLDQHIERKVWATDPPKGVTSLHGIRRGGIANSNADCFGFAKNPRGNVTRTRPTISVNPPDELMTFLKSDSDTEPRTCELASAPQTRSTQKIRMIACFHFLSMLSAQKPRPL